MLELKGAGIYYIECLINNKKYVGSAQNLKSRMNYHFKALKNGTSNKLLQEDYNKYGKVNFKFVIVENLPNDDEILIEKENFYMDFYKTYIHKFGHDFGYNIARANRTRPAEITKQKMSNSLKGKNIGLTLEQCLEIKELLLQKKKKEQFKDLEIIIASKYNTSTRTIGRIIRGEYWCSNDLGGGYKDWMGYNKIKLYSDIYQETLKPFEGNILDNDKRIAKIFDIPQRTVQKIRLNYIQLKKG